MRPESEADLAEVIGSASDPFHIRGGGTRAVGVTSAAAVLETGGLSGVSLYEPGALTLVARAGTPLAEIEGALAAEGQRLAFEPMDHRGLLGTSGEPTIGGVVAANVSGPRRVQTGAARDFLLGVRFVDGAGQVVKNGGRVMKNVTGYDLVKLMCGSWGTLGVLTEVSLKVLPVPETAACLMIDGLDEAGAQEVMSRALTSPYEVTGAAHAPGGPGEQPLTLLRLEGFAGSVAYRTGRLQEMLTEFSVRVETDPERVAALWRWVRDVEIMQGTGGDVWKFSVRPSEAPGLVARLRASHPVERVLYDWGGGLIWVESAPGTDLRPKGLQGHATLIRASEQTRLELPVFQPEPTAVAALSAGIRARFDPRGMLNPGIMA
ncbi:MULTISPECIES: FAD-binding protein [Mameliella]|uniref:FAD-binding protein n=1 Tax=Mameliella TaxID=1434019 RepID=UPI000B5331A7|nr:MULTISPECIES: FAD-binding protein [Mameliella]MCR9271717.1 FAD-binding protein [Paracoccaceae bacterium]MBY6121215.1 FAD-binding protein [Mameliella alba]OWV41496.1 2-hydroxy-acid oxidase [Mameliella alba]OWV60842.1 2-hydroxy-acid oxidase [Mameliella alba]OWV61492.1 2-hydroxy-acid oxidase [Mameliella alba]